MIQHTYIHSYPVSYEDTNAKEGMIYLRDELDEQESKVFFEQAHRAGSAEFQDEHDRQFTLMYENEKYVIIRR